MTGRVSLVGILMVLGLPAALPLPHPPLVEAAAQAAAPQGTTQAPSQSNMQNMMKMREQMMAEMKAGDAKLDMLVAEMNKASGPAKADAIAAVVSELVRQQQAMHGRMDQMQDEMMMMMMMDGRGMKMPGR